MNWITRTTLSAAATVFAAEASAQEVDVRPGVSIELNAAATSEGACTLSFLVTNGYEHPIEQAVFETVLFDRAGQVERLTLFDFGALPPARPRVRQFALSDVTCDAIGRVLINGASTCEAPDLGPGACMDGLQLTSRADIDLSG